MKPPNHPLFYVPTTISTIIMESWRKDVDEFLGVLSRLMRGFYEKLDLPALSEFSRLFQEALQTPGVQLLQRHLVWIVLGISLMAGSVAVVILWRISWPGFRVDEKTFKTTDQAALKHANAPWRSTANYLHSLVNGILEGIIVVWCVWCVTTFVFVLLKILWFSYLASPIGHFYPVYFPQRAKLVSMVMGQDILIFPLMLTAIAFMVALICAACCRLFYLTRFIYLPRSVFGKIVLVGLPINLAAAFVLRPFFHIPDWGAAYAATLIPTLLSFVFCFRVSRALLPELGMLFSLFRGKSQTPACVIYLRFINTGKSVIEFDPISGRRTGKQYAYQDGVQAQGQLLSRRGHDFILYRYGRDLFFRVDHLELALRPDMSGHSIQKGRFSNVFELVKDEARLFRIRWSTFPSFVARGPTAVFFDFFEEVLRSSEVYENVFQIEEEGAQSHLVAN